MTQNEQSEYRLSIACTYFGHILKVPHIFWDQLLMSQLTKFPFSLSLDKIEISFVVTSQYSGLKIYTFIHIKLLKMYSKDMQEWICYFLVYHFQVKKGIKNDFDQPGKKIGYYFRFAGHLIKIWLP